MFRPRARSKGDRAIQRSSTLWVKVQWFLRRGRREDGPRHERRPMEAPRGGLGGAPRTEFARPLTRRSNDGNDGETESCEEKGAQGRSQGTQDQARREEGCDQTRSSGSRGPRAASPDRQASFTPPRPEGRQGAPRRRPEGRGSPRCPQGRGARQGAPHRQEGRRASSRAKGSGSRPDRRSVKRTGARRNVSSRGSAAEPRRHEAHSVIAIRSGQPAVRVVRSSQPMRRW
jgi:hypothetical protein